MPRAQFLTEAREHQQRVVDAQAKPDHRDDILEQDGQRPGVRDERSDA
jgi:hypothetical protein